MPLPLSRRARYRNSCKPQNKQHDNVVYSFTLGAGIAIAVDRTKTASRQQKIEDQIQALEHRLQLYEQATSPDEAE
ncbi:hypothetical protein OUZ56_016611 [Daphnia magna]|uniref:Uncharacterized protein n=1 Tax=Daphnia magna TaxID=35525 RepID=A0ABR0AR26_9CRUS|nr:hypothetical protein OUZ56_016611 [Daphnia magna]